MTQLLKYKSGKMTALSVIAFTATIVTMLDHAIPRNSKFRKCN